MPDNQTASFWAGGSAEASPGGSTSRSNAPCRPYPCTEIEAFLLAHPEKECALLRAFIARQRRVDEGLGLR